MNVAGSAQSDLPPATAPSAPTLAIASRWSSPTKGCSNPAPKPPPILPPDVAKGLLLTSTDTIHPPDAVRVDMVHAGKDNVEARLKLCVDEGGHVSSVKLLKGTGFEAYDRHLMSAMNAWRYRPYKVNNIATPMCTVQQVVYRMRK